jgi:hypothetical protein
MVHPAAPSISAVDSRRNSACLLHLAMFGAALLDLSGVG